MNKAYERIVWENYPSEKTPLNETNLNKIDAALDTVDNRVVNFDTTKANQTDLLQSLKTVTYNEQTGLFTFTWWNGTTKTIDLNIEKIPVSFSMSAAGVITMTNTDGTKYTADVSTLIKMYTFNTSSDIRFNTATDASGNKTITAFIVDGSVTESKLQPNFLADCRAQATSATMQAIKAQSYAVGGTGTRTGEDADNSKYYYEQTRAISPSYEGIAVTRQTAPLTLSDSKLGAFNLTQIDGQMEQETTTGKNMLNNVPLREASTVRYAYQLGLSEKLVKGEEYTIQFWDSEVTNGSNDAVISIFWGGGTGDLYLGIVSLDSSGYGRLTFTAPNTENTEADNPVLLLYNATSENASPLSPYYMVLGKYQLEIGTTATDYEPYTGGKPSPSPDYPQEIKKVTVDKVRTVGKNRYQKTIWKRNNSNAFNSSTDTNTTRIRNQSAFEFIGNPGSYTISGLPPGITFNGAYAFDKDKNGIGWCEKTDTNTFIVTENVKYIYILCNGSNFTSETNTIMEMADIQIEQGSETTVYEPYRSKTIQLTNPVDLYGNDTVKDRLYRDSDGLLKVERKYKEVNLSLLTYEAIDFNRWKTTEITDNAKTTNSDTINALCNSYTIVSADKLYLNRSMNAMAVNVSNDFLFRNGSTTETPTGMLVYELAESTTETLPTADQIALNSIPTYDTVTYLELIDTEVEPEVSGEYGVSKTGAYTLAAKQQQAVTDSIFVVENGMLCAVIDIK